VHCSAALYEKDHSGELSFSEVIGLLNQIDRLGVPRINLSGGETLLRSDIFDIIKYATKKFVVVLESNGQLLNEENARRLKKAGLSCIAVSIDSHIPHEHDKLRNLDGCFKRAVSGIASCIKQGIPCLISTYIPSEKANFRDISGLMSLAKKMKVLAVRVMPPRPVGSFSCHVNSLLDKVQERYIENNIDPAIAYFKGIPAPKVCGVFTKATFYVSPYGEIQPCPFLPLSFGNIKEQELQPLLEKMFKHRVFDKQQRDCLILNPAFRKEHIPCPPSGEFGKKIFPIAIER
jgi:MoaA/NifB/PqqE/SkfB family radical SAM enzyme